MIVAILIVAGLALMALNRDGAPFNALVLVAALAGAAMIWQGLADHAKQQVRLAELRNEHLRESRETSALLAAEDHADAVDEEPGGVTAAEMARVRALAVPGTASHPEHTLHRRWAPRPDQQLPPEPKATTTGEQDAGAAPMRARPIRDNPQA